MTTTIEDIAWPGPRPLSFEDGDTDEALRMLVGREDELAELLHVCQTYAVVEITAASGVGKTSFIAAAKPHLEAGGAEVMKARPWTDVLGEYYALDAAVTAAHDPLPLYRLAFGIPPDGDASGLRATLAQLGGSKPLVCIFDQVEELLRYQRMLGENLLALVGKTAAASGVPHVVIARTEFRDQLRPVEVRGAPTWHMLLPELADPEVIREVIESPVPKGVVLGQGFTDRLLEWWEAARSGPTLAELRDPGPLPTVSESGLLHLQALLWAVQRWGQKAQKVDPKQLTVANLDEYAAGRGIDPRAGSGGALMADALCLYIEAAVEGCDAGVWPNGPRLMLARAASHLSSAGFKVAQPASTLVSRAVQAELGSPRSGRDVHLQFEIDSPKGRIAAAKVFADRFQIEAAGVADGFEETWQVAEEMVGSLGGVLGRLAANDGPNILRRYRFGNDSVYELVHDGVAPALSHWADSVLEEPLAAMGGISARRGEIFDHDLGPGTFLDEQGRARPFWSGVEERGSGEDRRAVVKAFRWHGLGVHRPDGVGSDGSHEPVLFRGIVFEGCDFIGTLFKNVVFRDVSFEGCEMRGVAMLDCTFENVSFKNCELVGAAINRCTLQGVSFDCAGSMGSMDYVSFEGAEPGAAVEFRNLEHGAGLFLVGLKGGAWSFEEVELRHFSFETDQNKDVSLRLGESCKIDHALVRVPTERAMVEVGDHPPFLFLTGDTTIIPADAVDRGASTPE